MWLSMAPYLRLRLATRAQDTSGARLSSRRMVLVTKTARLRTRWRARQNHSLQPLSVALAVKLRAPCSRRSRTSKMGRSNIRRRAAVRVRSGHAGIPRSINRVGMRSRHLCRASTPVQPMPATRFIIATAHKPRQRSPLPRCTTWIHGCRLASSISTRTTQPQESFS